MLRPPDLAAVRCIILTGARDGDVAPEDRGGSGKKPTPPRPHDSESKPDDPDDDED